MADKFDISVSGHAIKAPDAASIRNLGESLKNPATFKEFAKDPKAHAQSFGISVDDAISERLKRIAGGKDSLQEFGDDPGGGSCTVAAVAAGAFVVSDTKIAVVV
jgi:hypothetical protein